MNTNQNYTLLEKGMVIEINDVIQLVENKIVFVSNGLAIPIGTIDEDQWTWFVQTDIPTGIERIVYLGDNKFGLKQLTSAYDEFLKLEDHIQADVFLELFEAAKKS